MMTPHRFRPKKADFSGCAGAQGNGIFGDHVFDRSNFLILYIYIFSGFCAVFEYERHI